MLTGRYLGLLPRLEQLVPLATLQNLDDRLSSYQALVHPSEKLIISVQSPRDQVNRRVTGIQY